MGSKAVKVSESTYSLLKKIAEEEDRTIKEVIDGLADERGIEDYAGSWELTDKEAKNIKESYKELWENWEL
ncbi:MAG: hypothetical protein MUP58_03230 [Candidatus Nanohaloarchaeota archaeon QJJ-9]|nr:hypothetical protein [Candidatus Nanohaloarchaeota archaeon QJJ-9]